MNDRRHVIQQWRVGQAQMAAAFGRGWRSLVQSFDDEPLAAASIGQATITNTVLNNNILFNDEPLTAPLIGHGRFCSDMQMGNPMVFHRWGYPMARPCRGWLPNGWHSVAAAMACLKRH